MMVEDVMIGYSRAAVNRRESPNTMFWNDIRQISSLAGHDRARAFRKSTETSMTPHRIGVSGLLCSLRSWLRA